MADNFTANAGSGGDTFAADEIAAVKYPRGKLSLGADGAANDAVGGAGAVTAAVQRVTLASDDPAVALLGTIDSDTSTIAGDTTSIDGKITACDTGSISGTVTANAGTNLNTSALALESGGNLATIAGDTTSIDGKITACNTGSIAGTVTANAGTNLNTSALALESGGNLAVIAGDTTSLDSKVTACNTGAVTVASSALPSGAATAANQLPDGHNVTVDNGAGASAVNIQDGGNSITVDGTITANAGSNLNTSALALESGGNLATIAGDTTSIDGKITACNTGAVVISSSALPSGASTAANQTTGNSSLSTIAGAVNGTEMQVDVVAALPAGDNNIGNVDIASALPAGDNNIGNVDIASAIPAGSNNIGDVDVASITNGAINGPGNPTIDSYTQAVLSEDVGTNNEVIAAPGASKQIWVYGIAFSCDTDATSVTFQDEDDTAITGTMLFAQYGGMSISPSGNFSQPIWKVATNKALEVDLVTGDIDGTITYAIVSV